MPRFRPSWLTDVKYYRLLEMIPGALVWTTFVVVIGLSIFAPMAAIIFIVIFDVFWLTRVFYVMIYLIMAYRRFRKESRIDWYGRIDENPNWRRLFHVIVLPTYKESESVLRGTLTAMTRLRYPLDRVLLVLATEGRDAENIRPIAQKLQTEFESKFAGFIVTEHPGNRPGEIAGKGANIAWAGHEVQAEIDRREIPYADVLVSTFDADTIPDPQYLAYLVHAFSHAEHPLRSSYQPIPVFHNNVWDALPLTRVVAHSTTIWLMGDAMRPDRLWTFSSHSMPFQALVDVGFWQTDVVSEDSRIFLQCFLRYDGDYRVVPMYIGVSMDTVQADTWWHSVQNQYKQIRRWAYGVENFPYMMWHFAHSTTISKKLKWKYTWNQLEGSFSWATAPLMIFILGWLPFQVDKRLFYSSILTQNAPGQLQQLMSIAMIGLVVSAAIITLMLPSRPAHVKPWQWLIIGLQWLLLPVTMILYGAIPATEAQTRLMLGKYLGFWVTEKKRGD